MNYKKMIIEIINNTSDEDKLKMIYRIIKRYLGLG